MVDPFFITGPALISFSGGRTSAYMLWRILQAHGGTLPDDVIVAFANTGKEREETLKFVHDCETHWGVPVVWLERDAETKFRKTSFLSACRSGEPFAELIKAKGYLPNAVTRFCTSELKVRVMKAFALSLGWTHWANVIGLRYDEGRRVLKQLANNDAKKERWTSQMPLSKARITKRDVDAFWVAQNFDLQLKSYEGNCDLCFLKSHAKLIALIRENPGMADWWAEQEAAITFEKSKATARGARFVTEYGFAELARNVDAQTFLFDVADDDEHDVECGLWCAGEAA